MATDKTVVSSPEELENIRPENGHADFKFCELLRKEFLVPDSPWQNSAIILQIDGSGRVVGKNGAGKRPKEDIDAAILYSDKDYVNVNANVIIRDCTHTVQLDFDMYDKEDANMKLKKLDKLIDELNSFRFELSKAARFLPEKSQDE